MLAGSSTVFEDRLTWEAEIKRSPYRLRFELNGGVEGPVDAIPYASLFVGALDRARALFDATFIGSTHVFAVVGSWPLHGGKDGFRALQRMGVPALDIADEWDGAPFCGGHRSRRNWRHRVVEITGDKTSRDTMLWSNLAVDFGIKPVAPVDVAFVDPNRRLYLHAYDDRGMDVISVEKEMLASLRRDFDAWILNYDRARIDQAFGIDG